MVSNQLNSPIKAPLTEEQKVLHLSHCCFRSLPVLYAVMHACRCCWLPLLRPLLWVHKRGECNGHANDCFSSSSGREGKWCTFYPPYNADKINVLELCIFSSFQHNEQPLMKSSVAKCCPFTLNGSLKIIPRMLQNVLRAHTLCMH